MIRPADYLAFLRAEYLADFIRGGGAAVKFVVPLDGTPPEEVGAALRREAEAEGYLHARVDAREVKLHMIDRLFFDVARQVPWDALARAVVVGALEELRFRLPAGEAALSLDSLAAANEYDAQELRRDLNRRLQQRILGDYLLAREFRTAMLRLCQAQVDDGAAAQHDRAAILEWLTGTLQRISGLKDVGIFQRIGRHSARHLLLSLTRWVTLAGRSGLVLELDIARYAVARRGSAGEGLYYTKAAAMDAYEVLRQLIDATDELAACLVVVGCAPEFLSDDARGIEAYHALKLRIWDEVHDRRRANPLAALVRLSAAAEPWQAPV
jgi:hypothetical protein